MEDVKVINVGSRSSQLALIQTNRVIEQLNYFYENNPDRLRDVGPQYAHGVKFNIVSMTTIGDKILDKPLPEIGAKSLFTKELEEQLLDEKVDFIVHSLKDLPTTLPHGCVIGAILKRDNPNDVMILKESLRSTVDPAELLFGQWRPEKSKIKIGTSSQRRIAMIKRCNEELECIDIRGNLNTRISKLDKNEGDYDAIILAKAGLDRMGWSERVSCLLSPEKDSRLIDWYYAVGQGAIAVECRACDTELLNLLAPIIDLKTTLEASAERSLMRKLEGGCSVPLGVRSTWDTRSKPALSLEGILLSIDGKIVHKAISRAELSEVGGETRPSSSVHITGIVIPAAMQENLTLASNLIECSNLGIHVASKMIDSGCLELMKQARH